MKLTAIALTFYIRKIARVATRSTNLLIAGVALKSLLSAFEVQAQIETDTLWVEGTYVTQNAETGDNVGNITIYSWAKDMAMVIPPTVWEHTTSNYGLADFHFPVYIDSTTGIQDFITNSSKAFPNPGNEINVFMPNIEEGYIEFITSDGKVAARKAFNSDQAYLPLNGIAPGTGIYRIITEDGKTLSGAYIKTNTPINGPASKPINTLKSTNNYEAVYWAKWVDLAGNFQTDSTEITFTEGNAGPTFLQLTPVGGNDPIDNQDISGFVVDLNNDYAPIADAVIEVYIPSTQEIFSTLSASDGYFLIEGLPLGADAYFKAGEIEGKGTIVAFPFTTIEEVVNPEDSINPHFGVVLPDNVPTSSWAHIGLFNSHGTNQAIVKYYVGTSFNSSEEATIDGYYDQLEIDLNNKISFVKSSVPLVDEGINIEKGTYNTNTYEQTIVTPLENSLFPVKYANSTMGVGNYHGFVHETFLAIGCNIVSWYSVQRADAPDFTLEDKDIMRDVSLDYWNAIYQDEKTYIPIQYMQENMGKSAGAKAKGNGEVKQEINIH